MRKASGPVAGRAAGDPGLVNTVDGSNKVSTYGRPYSCMAETIIMAFTEGPENRPKTMTHALTGVSQSSQFYGINGGRQTYPS